MAGHANKNGTDFAGGDAEGHGAHAAEAHGGGHADAHGGHHHNPHLHHHFDTEQQQFDSDKLGMWLFLTTEILLFAGLFCAYAVYRANHPEMFLFAHKFLDVKWGFINTLVLLFSSFTMAWAVRAAQLGQKKLLIGLLAITIACGGAFLGIKYIEYSAKFEHGTLWGKSYRPDPHALEEHVEPATLHKLGEHGAPAHAGHGSAGQLSPAADTHSASPSAASTPGLTHDAQPSVPLSPGSTPAAPEAGKENEAVMPGSTEAAEHGTTTEGKIPPSSEAQHGTTEPLPADHAPPEAEATPAEEEHGTTAGTPPAVGAAPAAAAGTPVVVEQSPEITATSNAPVPSPTAPPTYIARDATTGKLLVDHSHVPPAPRGPAGLTYVPSTKRIGTAESSREDNAHGGHAKWHGDIPPNPQIFFSIYFMMTGLHGIHVIIGMICIAVVLIISMRGGYGEDYMTPVDLVGLYWHLVDLIWIFLFPLLYLIH
jgi:cytochrome c oxidase subunit 3